MNCIHHSTSAHASTWRKTISYYLMHMIVASGVAYAVTGSWRTALALSLLEPAVQAVAYFFHDKAWSRVGAYRGRNLAKTGTYYVMHMVTACAVAYAVTGSWVQAMTLSLLEPTVQVVFFYWHETLWDQRAQRRAAKAAACP